MGERERVIEEQSKAAFIQIYDDKGNDYQIFKDGWDAAIAANLIRGASSVQQGDTALRKTSWDLKALLALPLDERNKILEDAAEKGAHLYAWSEESRHED